MQLNLLIFQGFTPDYFEPTMIREQLKEGCSTHIIAITFCSVLFTKMLKEEIGSNQARYDSLLDELIRGGVINPKMRVELNKAFTTDFKYEDTVVAILQNKIESLKPDTVIPYVDRFLSVMMENHNTRPLAYLIQELIDKIQAVRLEAGIHIEDVMQDSHRVCKCLSFIA